MKEHAIPQDITGYKFHIVGNMTLKQFAETALGFVIAFFIYKTNLIAPVKWTLILFSAGFGAALAFLPIEERPLDHWFITFFTILYKPTKFYWKKHSKVPEAFTYTGTDVIKNQINEVDLSPQRRERISEYLQSVRTQVVISEAEESEKIRSAQLLSIFDDHSLKVDFTKAEKLLKKPKLKVEVRSLVDNTKTEEAPTIIQDIVYTPVQPTFQDLQPTIDATPIKTHKPLERKVLSTDQVASEIEIPETINIEIEDKHKNEALSQGVEPVNVKPEELSMSYQDSTAPEPSVKTDTQSAVMNKDLPFPIKPSKPNKLVGMILSRENDLINQATVTLRDSQGSPVTAVKSNALGQFFVTSQLPNGTYTIEVAKEDTTFQPIQISLVGKVVDPLEIRSNE